LKDAVKKLAGKTVIDRAAVDELVRDLQRALLSADVNVKLVMQLSQAIKQRASRRSPRKGWVSESTSSASSTRNSSG